MHNIHTTAGFVINSRPYGDAGNILNIFTRDLGLISVIAQGIRLEKSKLRYYTQEYSLGKYSFVRGKEYWRLTSANSILNFHLNNIEDKKIHKLTHEIIARVALLLRRFLQGEEPQPELFDCVESFILYVQSNFDLDIHHISSLESLIVYRILSLLGYIGNDIEIDITIKQGPISISLLDLVTMKRKMINQHINKALQESHL